MNKGCVLLDNYSLVCMKVYIRTTGTKSLIKDVHLSLQ